MNHQESSQDAGNLQFRMQVWDIVRDIPVGKVTSYGAIARALGRPRNARLVGWAMHESPGDEDFPAHRVISSSGKLTAGWLFGHPEVMKQRLVEEDVPFKAEYVVDIKKCLWQPPLQRAAADKVHDFDDVPWLEDDLDEPFPGND